MLLWMVRTIYLPGGLCVCPNVDTPERLAALVDIAFNLAVSNQAGGTLRRRIDAGTWQKCLPKSKVEQGR